MSTNEPLSDFPASRGPAALGARLRRLSERLDREVGQLYAQTNTQFEQRWYGPFNQIRLHGPVSVGEIAARLGVTHAAASQTCTALANAGLISGTNDPADARRRLLLLTTAGWALAERMDPFWTRLEALSVSLDAAAGGLVVALDRLEQALEIEPVVVRFARLADKVD